MKKVFVIAITMILGLGLAAFATEAAAPFSGSWETTASFGIADPLTISHFGSTVTVDYAVGGWTFESISGFNSTGFGGQDFLGRGSVGAFSMGTYLTFTPATPAFDMWLSGAQISLAGVNLYGFFDLEDTGSGFLLGASNTTGDVTVTAEAYFNLTNSLIAYGYTYEDIIDGFADPAYASDAFHGCTSITIADDAFSLQTASYCACWSGADIKVQFPFGCISEVILKGGFTSTDGFSYFQAELNDIEFDVAWLTLDDFDLKWTLTGKAIKQVDMDISISSACLTPYFEFTKGDNAWEITGFELYALGLDYSFDGGFSLSIVQLLNNTDYRLTWGGSPVPLSYVDAGYYCANAYENMFKLSREMDACCGGGYGFALTNWSNTDTTDTLLGWAETDVEVSVGLGSNLTIRTGVNVSSSSVSWLLGFDVSF